MMDGAFTFLQLPDDLLAELAKEGEQERGTIPAGLYRGIQRPIPTVVRTGTVVYCRADTPDDFAYTIASRQRPTRLLTHQPIHPWSFAI